jgi:hypothetical protein
VAWWCVCCPLNYIKVTKNYMHESCCRDYLRTASLNVQLALGMANNVMLLVRCDVVCVVRACDGVCLFVKERSTHGRTYPPPKNPPQNQSQFTATS